MDYVIWTLALSLLSLLWRYISITGPRAVTEGVQTALHSRCGRASGLLQWYSLLVLGLGLLLLRTFYGVVRFEYTRYDWLQDDDLHLIPNLTESDKRDLEVFPTLRVLALASPCAGVAAGGVVVFHVGKLAVGSAQESLTQNGVSPRLWALTRKLNHVILVIALPMVFILLALRAQIHVLAVMTGSAWLPFYTDPSPELSWDQVKTLELGIYTTALEVALFFQYFIVVSFAILCMHFLAGSIPGLVRLASFQGVWLYVGCGLVRSVFLGICEVARHFFGDGYQVVSDVLESEVLRAIGPVFATATVMCVVNMVVVCGMAEVRSNIPHATSKFLATRALILVGQLQPGVLSVLVTGSPVRAQLEKFVSLWSVSAIQAKLLHASLLNFECLLVVLFNLHVWGFQAFQGETAEEAAEEAAPAVNDRLDAPLHSNASEGA